MRQRLGVAMRIEEPWVCESVDPYMDREDMKERLCQMRDDLMAQALREGRVISRAEVKVSVNLLGVPDGQTRLTAVIAVEGVAR